MNPNSKFVLLDCDTPRLRGVMDTRYNDQGSIPAMGVYLV